MKYYKIAVPELKKSYTYFYSGKIEKGFFCFVEVRKKSYRGIVLGEDLNIDSSIKYKGIKSVINSVKPLSPLFVDFILKISSYYFTDPAVFLAIAFPPKFFKSMEFEYCVVKDKVGVFLTDTELKIVAALKEKPMKLKEIRRMFGEEAADALANLQKLGIVSKTVVNPFKSAETVKRKAVALIKQPNGEEKEKLKKKSPSQYKIIDYLSANRHINFHLISELCDILDVSRSSFDSLEKKGFVKIFMDYPSVVKGNPTIGNILKLTEHQERFVQSFKENPGGVKYLYGVTGSGKTEVYLRCADFVIERGKTVLYLVPEIGLTPSVISRLKVRFGKDIAILHSGLSYGERLGEWLRISENRVKIVVGTRSSVFAPLQNPGLIIVDEEHDHSYKQENFPKYNAVHCALFRAKEESIPVILGSATPSIENFYNAERGKFSLFVLPKRVGHNTLPEVSVVDMREEFKKNKGKKILFSSLVKEKIEKTLKDGYQVMVFVNRRGFAPFLMCRKCGNIEMCPNCSVSLTVHSMTEGFPLQCHYCGFGKEIPDVCPNCGDNFIQMMGYGTQRVEKRLNSLFPSAKTVRIDRDTVKSKNAFEAFCTKMNRREADIVVGTQMISKGHHFPYLKLVCVLDADALLNIPDFRSGERAFSTLLQVGGRAGRESPGEVLIQTYKPEHYIFEFLKTHDYLGFYKKEINFRLKAGYPPAVKMIALEIKSADEMSARDTAEKLAERINAFNRGEVKMLGPVKASLYKIQNKYRYHIILKSKNRKLLRELFGKAVYPFVSNIDRKVSVIPDFDPYAIL